MQSYDYIQVCNKGVSEVSILIYILFHIDGKRLNLVMAGTETSN